MGVNLTFFGVPPEPDGFQLAREKFLDCPWRFFDGVRDSDRNILTWGDIAITRVMNSNIRTVVANRLEEAFDGGTPGSEALARLPPRRSLADVDFDDPLWGDIQALFSIMLKTKARVTTKSGRTRFVGVGVSQSSKILCRKRPHLIPMLDSVVQDHLWRVAKRWRHRPGTAPDWFPPIYDSWRSNDDVVPYLKMIKHDLRANRTALDGIRKRLSRDRITQVPSTASLLRIYEAALFLWRRVKRGRRAR